MLLHASESCSNTSARPYFLEALTRKSGGGGSRERGNYRGEVKEGTAGERDGTHGGRERDPRAIDGGGVM